MFQEGCKNEVEWTGQTKLETRGRGTNLVLI